MPNYHYVQQVGGAEKWKPIPASVRDDYINEHRPEFVTIHAVSKITEELEKEDLDKLTYSGPLNFDFDGKDIETVITKCNILLGKLEALSLNLASVRLYATGGKGFHIEVPAKCFMEKIPKHGTMNLPTIYREIALELFVDTLDLRVYSQRSGRMWRVPGNKRANGLYKVPVTLDEIYSMTPEDYKRLCGAPRPEPKTAVPELCVDLAVLYARSAQKVEDKLKSRGKHKRDPQAKAKARMPSVVAMMAGQGIRPDAGFHEIALQVAISASTAGQSEAEMLKACAGLVDSHSGDGSRYNTAAKRREELSRMFAYCDDNPCYEFSVGAVKSLLTHEAPDLDGIAATKEEIAEVIAEAAEAKIAPDGSVEITPDEFGDTTAGVTLSKFGVYADSEFGKKRICAVSFSDIHLLMSMETGQLNAYEAQVLVNGRPTGRQTMEMDTFSSVQIFNRFCARLGHAMQGSEPHVRGLMMRFVELAKKKGRMRYIAKREGLDVVNIPNHEDLDLRTPFSVWADGKGVILDPRIKPGQVDVSFQGYPDPRGKFRADLADAPQLVEWLKEPGNKESMRETLDNLFNCQRPEALGKLLGWYTASIYRMLFHKAYTPGQFPALHVNGAAGAGKCLAKNTLVRRLNGSVAVVQDIVTGDVLLGPDGKGRLVLGTTSGSEMLYKIAPEKGVPYTVNESHVLSFRDAYGGVANRSVLDWSESRDEFEWIKQAWQGWSVPGVLSGDFSVQRSPVRIEQVGVGDYYGFELDGDHLFLLGDFTVTHNTSMQVALMSLFYYNQAPKVLTPGSSLFAVQEHMAASASIPLILDEYKPNIMSAELHNKYKLMIRDAYNCRGMAKGGGNRDSDDYRSLHETELSAPLCFIAEAAEDESAVSERVVLVTLVKPASSVSSAWAVRYQAWARNSKHLTILGKWLVAQAVNTASIEGLRNEFDPLYNEARETYLLNASDLKKNLTTEAMANKQNAKERSVYNFTVARFGLMKFRALIDSIYGADEFKDKFDEMDAGIYTRMTDLQSATQAEWSKVLSMMSTISHHVDGEAPYALRRGYDYAFVDVGGRDCVEIALRNAYIRYRSYVRNSGQTPLFTGDLSFLHAIKDCSALVDQGVNRTLHVPGIYTFDVNELSRLGVEPFKG
jgi:hypothetical protein